MTVAVRVVGVTKRFGDHAAVEDVSFEVPAGVIYGVLGPNGAGKSTTLRMINDIIAPDAGHVELLGGLRPGPAAAPHVGFLPEERGLYPKMRVLDTLAFMGELRGLTGRDARARGERWLERLGLGQWRKNRIQELSKGMQQKVQFAAALIHEPELVILDEPWSGLDPINADVLREVVREQQAAGHTVLFSTHLMEQAEQICEHIFIIARGRKVLDGRLADVKRAAAADGRIALGFAADGRAAADAVLADRALVAQVRAPRPGDHADVEVELAAGATAQALLAALVGAGAGVRRFEVVTPTLHQIFVERVGRGAAEVAERRPGEAA
ncbi:MAG TPA: ATP-binding cassette domain-containing protein [Kofleriaceae bacterium]|nr:ATP-binding cassette domain-containing protein [Kofleriaceae bacterium]